MCLQVKEDCNTERSAAQAVVSDTQYISVTETWLPTNGYK